MRRNILIVEDELSLLNILEAYFKNEGFNVFTAENGLLGLEIFRKEQIDIVCCDVMMPLISGWKVAESIKKESNIPVILMTALSSEEDQLTGYELEIDDYITKPFSPKILVAKVKRLIKTYYDSSKKPQNSTYKYNSVLVDFLSRDVKVENTKIHLSKTEFDLLEFLIKNKGIAFDRVTILDEVWGMDVYVEDRVVDTNIKVLRKKIKQLEKNIITVFGVGYKYEEQ